MKRFVISILLLLLPLLAAAGIGEWISVVRVTSNFGEVTFEVMSNADYTAKTKEVWSRNRVLTQAIRLARDEWQKGEDTKDKPFLANIAQKAELKRLKTFPESAQADAYAAKMSDEEEARKTESKATSYLEKRIKALEEEIENATDYNLGRQGWIKQRHDEIETMRVELSERRAKDRERESAADQAKSLIETHIVALVNAPTAQTQPIML